MPSCGTCEYWEPIKHPSSGEATKVGHCVWRPPVLHLVEIEEGGQRQLVQRSYFPMIDADRRCGQWLQNLDLAENDFIEAERRDSAVALEQD